MRNKYTQTYDACGKAVEPTNQECTVYLDTSCIFYRWKSTDDIALECLGLTTGTDLSTILEEIDRKLCEFSGFNLSGFDLKCIGLDYDIFSFKDFAEAISTEVCTLKNGQFQLKLDTLNANLAFINKPVIQDTCIGYNSSDTIQSILQKITNKICEIDAKKNIVVSSPSIDTINTNTIELTACGEKNHTLKGEVKVSNLTDNKLRVISNGLYVPSMSDADIGELLDRINSVPALKEKLCNICSFNRGVGGSSNARICQCSIKIESVARYSGNNYSVIINTIDLAAAPFYWEVRNNLNVIIASGETGTESSMLQTFQMPDHALTGSYTVRYTSLSCECTDVKSFVHGGVQGASAPKVISAIPTCTDDSNLIIVNTQKGSGPENTIIIRNAFNQVIHTRTNTLNYNEFEITTNGTYTVTVYDSNNFSLGSFPYVVLVSCIGTVEPPEEICVTYNITNLTTSPVRAYFNNCDDNSSSALVDPDNTATICAIRGSFIEDDNLIFSEISSVCEAVCAFEIESIIIECD